MTGEEKKALLKSLIVFLAGESASRGDKGATAPKPEELARATAALKNVDGVELLRFIIASEGTMSSRLWGPR